MIIRKATLDDLEQLIAMRVAYMHEEKCEMTPDLQADLIGRWREYFRKRMPENRFIGIFGEVDGEVVSTAYLDIAEVPANPVSPSGRIGTVLNVLTKSAYRNQGIATKVLRSLLEEAGKAGVSTVQLAATESGRPVYEKLGFAVSPYTHMRIQI